MKWITKDLRAWIFELREWPFCQYFIFQNSVDLDIIPISLFFPIQLHNIRSLPRIMFFYIHTKWDEMEMKVWIPSTHSNTIVNENILDFCRAEIYFWSIYCILLKVGCRPKSSTNYEHSIVLLSYLYSFFPFKHNLRSPLKFSPSGALLPIYCRLCRTFLCLTRNRFVNSEAIHHYRSLVAFIASIR